MHMPGIADSSGGGPDAWSGKIFQCQDPANWVLVYLAERYLSQNN